MCWGLFACSFYLFTYLFFSTAQKSKLKKIKEKQLFPPLRQKNI